MANLSPFIERLFERAKKVKGRLALPEGEDPRVQEAAKTLLAKDAVSEIWLYGDSSKISIEDSRVKIWNTKDETLIAETINHFEDFARQKNKVLSSDERGAIGAQALNQAAMHLAKGKVDAALAGCLHTTAAVIRASLKGVGLKPGIKTLSGAFVMARGEEIFLYGDCGVIADPTPEQLSDIAEATAETFRLLLPHASPKIAFLSFSTKGSAEHPAVEKVQKAYKIFAARNTGFLADGELQFDAAFVPEVAARKAKDSPIQGSANCFIFPDLNTGNIAYKITERLGGFEAYGPILQGGRKPYLDLSRGASAKDIMVSGLHAVILASVNGR